MKEYKEGWLDWAFIIAFPLAIVYLIYTYPF